MQRSIRSSFLVLATTLAVSPLYATDTLISEDFESGNVGSGVLLSATGDTSVEVSDGRAKSGKYALRFRDTEDAEARSYHPSATFEIPELGEDGQLRVSFDYFVEEDSTGPQFLVDLGGTGDERLLRLVFNASEVRATINTRNEGKVISSELFPGDWHHIVIESGTVQNEAGFVVKVNGQVVQGLPYWEGNAGGSFTGVKTLRFFDDGRNEDTVWIDNVLVEKLP